MTRYSDLITHLQARIAKEGDQLIHGGAMGYSTFYLFCQRRDQCIALNKAVHRKNRHIQKLRNQLQKFTDEPRSITFRMEPGDACVETITEVFESLSKLHIAAGGKGLKFEADGMTIMATPIP